MPNSTASVSTRHPAARLDVPAKEAIALLEPFDSLNLDRIVVVATPEEADAARRELSRAKAVGFDTESRPTFRKEQESEGPHVVQFATADKAYLFQTHHEETLAPVVELLASKDVLKVGFGLAFERKMLSQKLGAELHSVLDLDVVFKHAGYRGQVGVKSAIAITLNRRFTKSKKISTTNWAAKTLNDGQIRYAANDAYAALCVYHAIESGRISTDPALLQRLRVS
jgi:ribonuclease D